MELCLLTVLHKLAVAKIRACVAQSLSHPKVCVRGELIFWISWFPTTILVSSTATITYPLLWPISSDTLMYFLVSPLFPALSVFVFLFVTGRPLTVRRSWICVVIIVRSWITVLKIGWIGIYRWIGRQVRTTVTLVW